MPRSAGNAQSLQSGAVPKTKDIVFTAVAVYVLAFVIRIVFLSQFQSMPSFDHPNMDEQYHIETAHQINSAEGLPKEPYFRAPLYTYFLAIVLQLTGDSLYWSRFVQIILASLMPIVLLLLGNRLVGFSAAVIASVACALYPTLIIFDTSFLTESIMGLVIVTLCLVLYRCEGKPSYINFIVAGFLLGIAGLLRPNILTFGPALGIWIWLVIKPKIGLKKTTLRYLLLGLTTLITILPVTVRNYLVGDDFVLIAWQGGFNFYLGNNIEANGWSATVSSIDRSWQGGYLEQIKTPERAVGHPLKKSEISDYWYGRARGEITANVPRFAKLLSRKLRLFFNGEEIPNNQNTYLLRRFSPLISGLLRDGPLYFPYGLLAPLALTALLLLASQWRKFLLIYLLLASYIATLLLFFICDRYRQPVIPIMILLAAGGMVRLYSCWTQRQWRIVIASIVLFALVFFDSNHSLLGIPRNVCEADDRYTIGCDFLDNGDLAKAKSELELAIRADPNHALALLNLGQIERKRDNIQGALNYYRQAIAVDSLLWQGYLSAAWALDRLGKPPEGIELLGRAEEMFPDKEIVFLELALACWEQKDSERATGAIEKAYRLNPDNPQIKSAYNFMIVKP